MIGSNFSIAHRKCFLKTKESGSRKKLKINLLTIEVTRIEFYKVTKRKLNIAVNLHL